MNNIIDIVWALANEFVDGAKLVIINDEVISSVVEYIIEWKEALYANRASNCACWRYPKCIEPTDPKATIKIFIYELIANSVNYCYWYGRHDIRPSGSSSTKMYDLLDESFNKLEELKKTASFHPHDELEIIVTTFIGKLSRARFPLIDRRVEHLTELLNRSDLLSVIEISVHREDYTVKDWLNYIITSFPGYSKDLFLKRAFLFIMQMYRRCGIFEKEVGKVLVPADYQVPRVLRELGCIRYSDQLAWVVDDNMLIPEDSIEECEIRAATIVVCKRIADLAKCTCEEVDTYLWNQRHSCTMPFHLCRTSNY